MESVEQKLDFGSVYAEHAPFVRRTLAKHGVRPADLDDVLQDVFVTVHRLLPDFEGRSSIETWLYSVSWRVAAQHQRSASKRYLIGSEQTETSFADGPVKGNPDKSIHAALGQLDAEQRDVIALHDVAGFTVSEVAQLTGRARATIRERLDRARTALGRRLWRAITKSDEQEWLDELAPQLALRLAQRDRPKIHHRICEGVAISRLDDIVFVLWRGQSSVAGLEVLIEMMLGAVEDHPGGIRLMCIIEATSAPPAREARQLMSWGAGKLGPKLRAAANAVEDLHMMSLVAPIMNACFFVGGVPCNMRFFDGVSPASRWLSEHGSHPPTEIAAQVEHMRQQLPPV